MRPLTAPERRVLGCLVEKARTTPQAYPLTLNAVRLACNQSTARDPVVHYDEGTVIDALTSLRAEGLTRVVHSTSNRGAKHRHVLGESLEVDAAAEAVLALLLLRGPQTVGELHTRSERLHDFAGLDAVHHTLAQLAARPEPLVVQLERRPGQKEQRWDHLLGAEPTVAAAVPAEHASAEPIAAPAVVATPAGGLAAPAPIVPTAAGVQTDSVGLAARVASLEVEVADLRAVVARLRAELGV